MAVKTTARGHVVNPHLQHAVATAQFCYDVTPDQALRLAKSAQRRLRQSGRSGLNGLLEQMHWWAKRQKLPLKPANLTPRVTNVPWWQNCAPFPETCHPTYLVTPTSTDSRSVA